MAVVPESKYALVDYLEKIKAVRQIYMENNGIMTEKL